MSVLGNLLNGEDRGRIDVLLGELKRLNTTLEGFERSARIAACAWANLIDHVADTAEEPLQ